VADTTTDRDVDVLKALEDWLRDKAWPPSWRALGEKAGLTSPNSINRHLARLRDNGMVDWERGEKRALPRTLHLTAGGYAKLREARAAGNGRKAA